VTRIEKALQKLQQNPKNVRPKELETLLLHFGFEKRSGKGNHTFYKRKGYQPLSIPYQKPFLKPYYVKQALQVIERIIENEQGDPNDSANT
jgi:predicted RNA binding protein YcfA (HicA-like mRNA interferase family)